jgi:hypothetical protein
VFNFGSPEKKEEKKLANRVFRRKEKQAIRNEEECPEDLKEVSNVWSWACDGWSYVKDFKDEWMRK